MYKKRKLNAPLLYINYDTMKVVQKYIFLASDIKLLYYGSRGKKVDDQSVLFLLPNYKKNIILKPFFKCC